MKIVLLVFLLCLSSCIESVIGGIGVGTLLFSKKDYTLFPSIMVHNARKRIAKVQRKNNQPAGSIKIIHNDDTIYVIGLVSSSKVKSHIIAVVDLEFHRYYVDEISISVLGRKKLPDFITKLRIRKKLLVTPLVKSQNYKVIVYNSKAYVIGNADDVQEKEAAVASLSQIEYIDDIVVYIDITNE